MNYELILMETNCEWHFVLSKVAGFPVCVLIINIINDNSILLLVFYLQKSASSVYLSTCLHAHLYTWLSVYLSSCLLVYLLTCLPFYLAIGLSLYMTISISSHLSTCRLVIYTFYAMYDLTKLSKYLH